MIKKYLPFFKAGAMDLLAFKFSVFTWLIISSFQIVCVIFLWLAVYKSSSNGLDSIINGFTFNDIISYTVMINIFVFVSFDGTTLWTINDEIKNGTIAMSFTKPISYRIRLLVTTYGATTMNFIMLGIPCIAIAYISFGILGFIEFVSFWMFLLYIVLFLVARLIAVTINDTINYIFGILCFYTSSGWGINQIKEVLISFLAGTLIPLSFFPSQVKDIVNYLPFANMAQNPALIMLMKVDVLESLKIIGIGIIWIIILESFGMILFKHASKKITVQGG